MTTLSVQLAVNDQRFIQEAVKSGRYSDESDVVAEALAELQARERSLHERIAEMHGKVAEGIAQLHRGEVEELDLDWVKQEGRKRLAERQSTHR